MVHAARLEGKKMSQDHGNMSTNTAPKSTGFWGHRTVQVLLVGAVGGMWTGMHLVLLTPQWDRCSIGSDLTFQCPPDVQAELLFPWDKFTLYSYAAIGGAVGAVVGIVFDKLSQP